MAKTILVPIDIAEPIGGAAALELARDLAKIRGGKLVLLTVLERVPGYIASQISPEFHRRALGRAAEKLGELAGKHDLPEPPEIVVRDGHPSTEILEYASKIDADMIIIASHDPGLVDYFLGSVAARVVRHARCSVLVAR